MGTRLFVGNLSYNVTEQELRDVFSSEGIELRSVRVALDRETGRPRGFAFVETVTDDGAKASIATLSGRMVQGRSMIVEEAQARTGPGGPRPGGGPGGAPGGPPRPGGFGAPRPPGAGPAGGGFGAPRPGGPPPGAGGFGPRPGGFGGAPPAGGGGFGGGPAPFRPGGFTPGSTAPGPGAGFRSPDREPRKERPEKKRSSRPRPEERERGNWRWNGKVDEDD